MAAILYRYDCTYRLTGTVQDYKYDQMTAGPATRGQFVRENARENVHQLMTPCAKQERIE